MSVAFIRIDERLIHGQIIEAWIPQTHTNAVLIVDDELCINTLKKTILSLTIPESIRLFIEDTNRAVELLLGETTSSYRMMILFPSIEAIYRFYKTGIFSKIALPAINVGNLHKGDNNIQITDSIFIDDVCVSRLTEMENAGLVFEFAPLPRSEVMNLGTIIDLFKGKDTDSKQ